MGNSFLENIISIDEQVLIFFNSFGTEQWDPFWLFITKQLNWIPVFIILLAVLFYKLGLKKAVFTLLFLTVLIAFSDQLTNLVKTLTGRTRPCNVAELQEYLRQFSYKPKGNSFWSGHAFVSTTFSVFMILLLKPYTKFIYGLVLFPILFGFSRIYLGVHFPSDIVGGFVAGFIWVVFCILVLNLFKVFREDPNTINLY